MESWDDSTDFEPNARETISIKSKMLVELLEKYEQVMKSCERRCDKYRIEGDFFELVASGFVPGWVPRNLFSVAENLGQWLGEFLYGKEDDFSEDELDNLYGELVKNEESLMDSIEKIEWTLQRIDDGESDDIKYTQSSYDQNTLKKILAKIAEMKGCIPEDVTDDDFGEYVSDKMISIKESFTYGKDAKDQVDYTWTFELVE